MQNVELTEEELECLDSMLSVVVNGQSYFVLHTDEMLKLHMELYHKVRRAYREMSDSVK